MCLRKNLIVLTAAATAAFGATSVQADLVGHWTFDGDLADQVHGNDAVTIGDASVGTTNGISGGAASFDGDGDALQIVGDLHTRIGQTMSISFWEYSGSEDNDGYFLGSGDDSNGTNQIWFRRLQADTYNGVVNTAGGASATRLTFSGGPIIDRGQWNHSLIVLNASGSGVEGKWYVNGELMAEGTGGSAAMADLLITDLFVGNRKGGDRDFLGLIDDLQIYDTLLTADDAEYLWSNPGSVIPEPASAMLLFTGSVLMISRRRRAAGWRK